MLQTATAASHYHMRSGGSRAIYAPPKGRPSRSEEREGNRNSRMPPKFKRFLDRNDVYGAGVAERASLLDGSDDDEEDFFVAGGGRRYNKDTKIKRVQGQVDEVIEVMQDNVAKVIDRGENLELLQDKSEELSDHSIKFLNTSKRLKSTMRWHNCKMYALLFTVLLVIILVIVLPIIIQKYRKQP
ncbi:vesicle-associated membrane protein 4-like isoform X1 [Branchiostoma lanceolatum]|uniref:vesicle-associated membrane protein 4-like isoform X1 n=1 Tax=Branchiostoma lanceolatum TaxID=7740 RepID=UPI003456BE9B